jgi:hypothetical protein
MAAATRDLAIESAGEPSVGAGRELRASASTSAPSAQEVASRALHSLVVDAARFRVGGHRLSQCKRGDALIFQGHVGCAASPPVLTEPRDLAR